MLVAAATAVLVQAGSRNYLAADLAHNDIHTTGNPLHRSADEMLAAGDMSASDCMQRLSRAGPGKSNVARSNVKILSRSSAVAIQCMKAYSEKPMLQFLGLSALTENLRLAAHVQRTELMEMERVVSAVMVRHQRNTALSTASMELLELLDAQLLDEQSPSKPPLDGHGSSSENATAALSTSELLSPRSWHGFCALTATTTLLAVLLGTRRTQTSQSKAAKAEASSRSGSAQSQRKAARRRVKHAAAPCNQKQQSPGAVLSAEDGKVGSEVTADLAAQPCQQPRLAAQPCQEREEPGQTQLAAPAKAEPEAREADELADSSLCVVCVDAVRTHAVVPCGHKCFCEDCASSSHYLHCPLCRGGVKELMRVWD